MIIPDKLVGDPSRRIEVSAVESQHHLHFFDNKVLPTQLTPEQARSAEEKKWWYDPKYIITELNVNSAIARPAHEEILMLDPSAEATQSSIYELKGYAYSGGTEMCYQLELAGANVISVRGMDESMNMQPRDMYPNATSMMNNWWHRVAILKQCSVEGVITELRFVHPAPVGKYSAGWMELMTKSGANILRPDFSASALATLQDNAVSQTQTPSVPKGGNGRLVTLRELRTQPKDKPWFVVDGEVYDGTGYLHDHPGGEDSILLAAGEDASEDFRAIHSADAWAKLRQFHVGTLIKTGTPNDAETEASEDETSGRFLSRVSGAKSLLSTLKSLTTTLACTASRYQIQISLSDCRLASTSSSG
ncbi:uncharacterized protein B0H18DRAFT_952820 [Fomitopsis serialis]|uniref:uncharacterized protein n=1 Tax=Fomitopsis serialis TaxID=139415 RepID=UPI002008789E|nr:uncharacterized protein B0H18DRAFT_952820 [Neoantrodia serialis]KAH9931315.1 hypothetical protein B0H18DRAFT_952820 [Neoantrodia serialis]